MKKLLSLCAALTLLLGTSGLAAADVVWQWSLPHDSSFDPVGNGYYTNDGTATGTPLYSPYWAAHVTGSGFIPSSSDPVPGDGYYYNQWRDGTDARESGTFALGIPDFYYGDPEGIHELFGGAAGFSPHCAPDSWMILGFDRPLVNQGAGGVDLRVYQFGWGGAGMEILVSSDGTVWTSLGNLALTSKPVSWGTYAPSPYMDFEFSDYGVDNISYVMFAGNGHWIDAVGTPTPIPGAVWLLGSGLLGLVGIRRRHSKNAAA